MSEDFTNFSLSFRSIISALKLSYKNIDAWLVLSETCLSLVLYAAWGPVFFESSCLILRCKQGWKITI